MPPVTLNPTISSNPYDIYINSLNKQMQAMGISPTSPQGRAIQYQAVQQNPGLAQMAMSIGKGQLVRKGVSALVGGGGSAAAEAGGMSIQPATTLADIQSLSNGGAALQSTAPEAFQTLNTGASAGASGAGEAASAATTAPGTMASIAPYLGLAGAGLGAYGMYKGIGQGSRKATAMGGAALGGGLAAASPLLLGTGPVGWGILAASLLGGAAVGGAMGHIKTGKSLAQQSRDGMRGNIQGALGLDKNNFSYNNFDFGADGKHTFKSADGGTHRGYEVDMSNPLAVSTIPALQQFVSKINPNAGDTEQKQTIGMLANALMNGATDQGAVQKNLANLYTQAHFGTAPGLSGPGIKAATRSRTLSPGIGKDGKRISY